MKTKGRILKKWSFVSFDDPKSYVEIPRFNVSGYLLRSNKKIITSPVLSILKEDGFVTVLTRKYKCFILLEKNIDPEYLKLCPNAWQNLLEFKP